MFQTVAHCCTLARFAQDGRFLEWRLRRQKRATGTRGRARPGESFPPDRPYRPTCLPCSAGTVRALLVALETLDLRGRVADCSAWPPAASSLPPPAGPPCAVRPSTCPAIVPAKAAPANREIPRQGVVVRSSDSKRIRHATMIIDLCRSRSRCLATQSRCRPGNAEAVRLRRGGAHRGRETGDGYSCTPIL